MGKKGKFLVLTGLVFLCLFFLLLGCSTMGRFFGMAPSPEVKSSSQDPTGKEIREFFTTVREPRGNPESHYLLAKFYQERGKHRQAISEFEKVLYIDPGYVKAYNGLGISYDLQGDFPNAVQAYQEALKIDPNSDYIQNNLGYSLLMQGNIEEAIASFNKAIALNDKKEIYHNNLGLAYARKGEAALALNEFKFSADEAQSHYLLANVFYEKGLYNQAKEQFSSALNLNPDMEKARTKMAAAESLAKISDVGEKKAYKMTAEIPQAVIPKKSETPAQTAVIRQPRVGIEISNGNGINWMAHEVSHYLKESDLNVVRLTNADHFSYPRSRIYYQKGCLETANQINKKIPGSLKLEEVKSFDRPFVKVKLLIGKDLAKHKKIFDKKV